MDSVPTMLTIKQIAQRCSISECFVRRLVHERLIVFHRSGTRVLINYERFIEYLNAPEPPASM